MLQKPKVHPRGSTWSSVLTTKVSGTPEAERLAQYEVRRQPNKAIGYCEACNWRFCSDCNTLSNHEAKGGTARGGKRSKLTR